MAGKEPVVGPDAGDSPQVTTTPGSARWIEIEHAVHQQHLAALNGGRAHMGLPSFKPGAEPGVQVALGKGAYLFGRQLPVRTNHGRRVQARVGPDGLTFGCPQHAGRFVQFLLSEEASLALAHSQRRSAVHSAIIVKEEQADLALAGVAVHMDVVAKRVAGPGQAAVVGQVATEKAVPALSPVQAIDAQVRDEKEISLACLDHDPRGHESAVQEPRVLAHVGLGPHCTQTHRSSHCVQAHHSVGKQQGRLGHAHLDRVFVLRFELGTEQV